MYDGVRRDWRWDQVDDRSWYLAWLVRELKLSRGPVIDQLAGDEEASARAGEVLESLALAGCEEAREGLREYVRTGEHWVRVLESVTARWPAEWWADLGEVARARIGGEAEPPWAAEPWTRFGIAVRARRFAPRPVLDGLDDEELLGLLADRATEDDVKVHALRTLRGRGPAEGLIPLVPGLGTPDGRWPLPALTRAVEDLGARAVPAARGWARDGRPWLARLGADVLADHGGPEVLPGLLAKLARQWAAPGWCGPDRTARRLARFGPKAAEAVPYLRRFWLVTPHSYERAAYLTALAAIDQGGLDLARAESLWDCEETARLLAVATAPDRPGTRGRIVESRDDPSETPEVRAAARARLAAAGAPPPR
ncbi:hypothetical protein RM844_06825 [Streptomyces sp. DSM 44915]|uniref:HEAT repeat domain-containing protein n=1 Tax=Streptomyces chisholmiae TaxID=3075540 RepID=A0ABU2JLZ7_9ACTN|nr:hypothetical protein [Streptomyces sp. DSM 44915]MDT0266005.1 hypothetical protein [Streptomyces sp. DSM 44915]